MIGGLLIGFILSAISVPLGAWLGKICSKPPAYNGDKDLESHIQQYLATKSTIDSKE